MTKTLKAWMTCLFVVTVAAGCAAPPIPFQLIDSESRVQWGTIYPNTRRIEVTVDGHVFNGFYIVASGEAVSDTLSGRRFFPSETFTTYSSNAARAHLSAENGQQLSCKFLFESKRAIGECRTPAGAVFQLIADENPAKIK